MRLKRWESPRRQGRNDKGRGGSARQRQLRKQQQQLRQKLKQETHKDCDRANEHSKQQSKQQSKYNKQNQSRGGSNDLLPSFLSFDLLLPANS